MSHNLELSRMNFFGSTFASLTVDSQSQFATEAVADRAGWRSVV